MSGAILVFSGVRGDTRRYRSLHLFEQLRLAGANCALSHLTDARLPALIHSASIAILHRVSWDGYVEKLLRELRARNALVVMDADDFLYDPSIMRWIDSPDFQDPVRAALYRQELGRHRAALERCDGVTVSTGALAEMLAPFGKPVHIHRNAFSLEMLARSQQSAQNKIGLRAACGTQPDRVVIGYASGTRTHDRDFALIRPALVEVMQRNPCVDLWLMGAVDPGEDWGVLRDRVRTFPLVPWRELPERLAMLDINLAPLVAESPFNQAKSEIKYMEAALVRVPTIASPTDAFSVAIRSGQNGMLAGDPETWRASLEALINHAEARVAMGEAAYQDALSRYAPWQRAPEILHTLALLAGQAGLPVPNGLPAWNAPYGAPDKRVLSQRFFSAADELHPTISELAWYSIRRRGVKALFGHGWVFFRRKLAPIFPFRSTVKK
jgi:glycosyltransferase involved in cell wall biosynthesis